jgi:retron-type reverse transcriptase
MIVSFSDIHNAYEKCKKNKANTINAIRFEIRLIDSLWELYDEINSFKYEPKSYICFMVHSPKAREVFASDFRDRVVHHLLVSDLEKLFEPLFIYDSYSCRKEKGTHNALKRVQSFSRKEKNRYYL